MAFKRGWFGAGAFGSSKVMGLGCAKGEFLDVERSGGIVIGSSGAEADAGGTAPDLCISVDL